MFRGNSKGILSSSVFKKSASNKNGLTPGSFKSTNIMDRTKIVSREKVFEFYTTHTGTFSVQITKTGQVAEWDFGDGQRVVGNSASITYSAAGTKKVRLLVDDFKLVTAINALFGINIIGTLDLRAFVNCTSFQIYDNQGVTKLLMPRPSRGVVQANQNIRTYKIQSLDISMMENMSYWASTSADLRRGINFPRSTSVTYFEMNATEVRYLNLQPLTFGSTMLIQNNVSLLSISFSPSVNTISSMQITGNTLLQGTLDLSGFSSLQTTLQLNGNSALTGITFPASSNNFTFIDFYSCNITGTIDLSGFSGNVQLLRGNSNPNLTGITLNSSNKNYNYFYFASCNLTGNLDCRNINLGGYFDVGVNPLLTSITHSTSTAAWVSGYYAYSCNLTGTHNISMLEQVGVDIRFQNNPLLTGIIWPTASTTAVTTFLLFGCNITGALDLTGLTNWGTGVSFQIHNNSLLTSVVFPSHATTTFQSFFASGCAIDTINFTAMPLLTERNNCNILLQNNAMSETQVNQILIDLDTNATGSFTGRAITINGTNAAPTGLGLTAKTSLISKGFSVTTN